MLYVAFFEIFAAEGKHLKRKYLHIIVAIIGFIFMGALEIIGKSQNEVMYTSSFDSIDYSLNKINYVFQVAIHTVVQETAMGIAIVSL